MGGSLQHSDSGSPSSAPETVWFFQSTVGCSFGPILQFEKSPEGSERNGPVYKLSFYDQAKPDDGIQLPWITRPQGRAKVIHG